MMLTIAYAYMGEKRRNIYTSYVNLCNNHNHTSFSEYIVEYDYLNQNSQNSRSQYVLPCELLKCWIPNAAAA